MHIAMIGQKGIPAKQGGVERHVEELGKRLVLNGHIVTVYSRAWYTGIKETTYEGINIVYSTSINTKHLDAITATFTSTLHAMYSGVDVIHYHGVGPSLLSWIPRVFTPRIKVVSTFHSIDRKHAKWGWFARTALWMGEWATCHFPHHTIAVSRTIAQYIRDTYSTTATYIPNGVPLLEKPKKETALKIFGLKKHEYIVAVSRLIPHKGIHYLIAAYKQLQKTHPKITDTYKLAIVGSGYHTEQYEQYLRTMAQGDNNIIMTGAQYGTDLIELLGHATIYIHPSTQEGLPITVLEAMSLGLPALVSDIPEHVDLITDTDFQFKNMNVSDLAEKIVSTLANDSALAKAGKQNCIIIKKEYIWDNLVDEIISVYTVPTTQKNTPPLLEINGTI
jgi:glycosyltransferase involved in cell wall biosynthesis